MGAAMLADVTCRNMARKLGGYTFDDIRDLVDLHPGHCDICHVKLKPRGKSRKDPRKDTPHIDHSHAHGHIRGILCSACNAGLGFFRDNPSFLREAVKYLERTDWVDEVDDEANAVISDELDWFDDEEPLVCGVENPEYCESCQ